MPISVSIVEDNDQLRGTLARVLNRAEGFRCVSHYANAEEAVKDLFTGLQRGGHALRVTIYQGNNVVEVAED